MNNELTKPPAYFSSHIARKLADISIAPTSGLYGVEAEEADIPSIASSGDMAMEATRTPLFYRQERKDLVKLGNIAMFYLKARPWASSPDGDVALWAKVSSSTRVLAT
jgi:hypothetical protein